MIKKRVCPWLLVVALVGCSSDLYTENSDWSNVGYHDAIKGQPARMPADFTGVSQGSQAKYEEGYLKGLKEYCNPNAAYQIGLSGQDYQGVCSGMPEEQKFRMEWQRGRNDAH